jgi:D-glycero-alpha-D-manno-heptose 1-phosphate guanylyltransferase
MTNTCIVLAGGLGTRLRGAVPDLPKCLAPIAGRPFLEWQLRSLAQRGISHFVLALGHGSEQVRDSLTQAWTSGLSIEYVIEREALGTGGATRFAMNEAGLHEALVVNGDTYLGGDLAPMLSAIDSLSGERMRIATIRVDDRTRFGGVAVDPLHRVTAFLEKGQTGAGVINAGLYRIHRSALENEAPGTFSMETLVMPKLAAGLALQARELTGPFIDIGIPADYRLFSDNLDHYVRPA